MDRSIRRQHCSRRWRSLLAVAAWPASEIAVAGVAGISGMRLGVLSIAAAVFASGHLRTPPPGKCHHPARDLRPVLVMLGAAVAAIAVTGGLSSPLLAVLPVPLVLGWTMFSDGRAGLALAALVPVVLAGLLAVPAAWTAAALDRSGFALVAAWTTVLSAALIGLRIRRLFGSLRATWSALDRVRNGALSDAESRRRGLESMTTKLAHELKNPLAAIKSLLQLELGGSTSDRSKRRLEVVFAESERMQAILRDYLSFDRPADAMCVATLELAELMAEIEALLAGRAEAAGVALSLRGCGGTLIADPRLLREAIVNVASNALEATPRGGTVAVTYQVGADAARIVVRDTGAGMTEEVRGRIGTPFFTTRDGSTGLGIVIARSALAQHHGTLAYQTAPGRGTTATIALPRDPCPAAGAAS